MWHRMRVDTAVNQYNVLAHNEQWDTESDSCDRASAAADDDDNDNGLPELSAGGPTRMITRLKPSLALARFSIVE